VVVEDGRPLGTVSEIEAAGVDRFAQVHQVMSGDLLTITESRLPRSSTS
jgi:IMP dehydrogenase